MAEKILMREYKELSKEKWVNVELLNEDILTWSIALIILNPSSLYHGGYFKATMTFPSNYPYTPPTFQFTRPLFHPNIYGDGKLCISILHSPGEDEMSGETAGERWSPVQRVESVLLSIISLLDDAETSSPANVDAGVLLRKDGAKYRARVREDVEKSKSDIPPGFEMPTAHENLVSKASEKTPIDDREFWVDSDMEEDDDDGLDNNNDNDSDNDDDDEGFGGSETEEDVPGDDDDGEGMDLEEMEMMEDREDEDEEEEEEASGGKEQGNGAVKRLEK